MSFCRQLFVAVLVATQAAISTSQVIPYSTIISESGPYSYWPLDSSTITQNPAKAIDIAGFRDANLESGDGGFSTADGATADNSQSLSLNLPSNGGSGAHASVPYSQYLNLNPSDSGNSFSIEGWVRLAANANLQQDQPFLSSFRSTTGNEGGYYIQCGVDSENPNGPCEWELGFVVMEEGSSTPEIMKIKSGVQGENSAWVYLAALFTSTSVSFHVISDENNVVSSTLPLVDVDNENIENPSASSNLVLKENDNSNLLIGGGPEKASSRSFIQGRVDNIAFYAYALTIEQMTTRVQAASVSLPNTAAFGNSEANPILITSLPFTSTQSTVIGGFTNDFSSTGCSDIDSADPTNHASPDVWFRYTPSEDVLITATLCNEATPANFDTILYILEEQSGSLVVNTCNDDGATSTCGFASQIENIELKKNIPYLFVVDGFGAQETGLFTFSIARVPFPANPGALYISSAIPLYTEELSQTVIDGSFAATVDSQTTAGPIVSGGVESVFYPHTGKYATSVVLDSFGQYSLFLASPVQTEGAFLNFWIYLKDAADWNSVSVFVGELDDEFADNGESASFETPLPNAVDGSLVEDQWLFVSLDLSGDNADSNVPPFIQIVAIPNRDFGAVSFAIDDMYLIRSSVDAVFTPAVVVPPPVEPASDTRFVLTTIYDDALASEWFMATWGEPSALVIDSEETAHSGLKSIFFDVAPGIGLQISRQNGEEFPLLGFFQLYIQPVTGALFNTQLIQVLVGNRALPINGNLFDENDQPVASEDIVPGEWYLAKFSLAEFVAEDFDVTEEGIPNANALFIVNAANADDASSVSYTFRMDDITFTSGAPQMEFELPRLAIPAPTPAPAPAPTPGPVTPGPTPGPEEADMFTVTKQVFGEDGLNPTVQDVSFGSANDYAFPAITPSGSNVALLSNQSNFGTVAFGCGFAQECETFGPAPDADVPADFIEFWIARLPRTQEEADAMQASLPLGAMVIQVWKTFGMEFQDFIQSTFVALNSIVVEEMTLPMPDIEGVLPADQLVWQKITFSFADLSEAEINTAWDQIHIYEGFGAGAVVLIDDLKLLMLNDVITPGPTPGPTAEPPVIEPLPPPSLILDPPSPPTTSVQFETMVSVFSDGFLDWTPIFSFGITADDLEFETVAMGSAAYKVEYGPFGNFYLSCSGECTPTPTDPAPAGLRFYAAPGDETTDLSTLFVEVLSDFRFVEGVVVTPFMSLQDLLVPNDEGVPEPFQTFYYPLGDYPDQEWAGISIYDLFGLNSTMIFDEIRFVSVTDSGIDNQPPPPETTMMPPPTTAPSPPVEVSTPPTISAPQPPVVEVSPSPPTPTASPSPEDISPSPPTGSPIDNSPSSPDDPTTIVDDEEESSDNLSNAAIAGIVIGSVVGFILLVALVVVLAKRSGRTSSNGSGESYNQAPTV